MADKLTPQQRMAVENRGGKLLVSAAAGSGKTKAAMYAMSQVDTWKLLLICVPSMELVEQWEGDVRLFYPDIRIIKCSSAYSEAPALIKALAQAKFPGQTVVISTYDSAIKDSNMVRWKAVKLTVMLPEAV